MPNPGPDFPWDATWINADQTDLASRGHGMGFCGFPVLKMGFSPQLWLLPSFRTEPDGEDEGPGNHGEAALEKESRIGNAHLILESPVCRRRWRLVVVGGGCHRERPSPGEVIAGGLVAGRGHRRRREAAYSQFGEYRAGDVLTGMRALTGLCN